MLLFCFATSYLWFVAACIVWGVASSVGGAAPAAYAVDLAPPGMNAAAMGLFRMTSDAGYVHWTAGLGADGGRLWTNSGSAGRSRLARAGGYGIRCSGARDA